MSPAGLRNLRSLRWVLHSRGCPECLHLSDRRENTSNRMAQYRCSKRQALRHTFPTAKPGVPKVDSVEYRQSTLLRSARYFSKWEAKSARCTMEVDINAATACNKHPRVCQFLSNMALFTVSSPARKLSKLKTGIRRPKSYG